MPVSRDFALALTTEMARLGISQREVARRTNISPGYISNMCLGQIPSLGKLLQVTSGLGIDPAPLLRAAGYPPMHLSGAPPAPLARPFVAPDGDAPLLGEVPGGNWRLAVEESTERFPIHRAYQEVTDFCLRVVGDSMYPHLQQGDVVGVKAQTTAEAGQLVVARLGDEVTVKKWTRERGRCWLTPFNPLYQPIPIDPADPDFGVIGIVAWHIHDWLTASDRVAMHLQKQPRSS